MFLLEQRAQIRVGHEEQVGEAGSKEGSINIGKFLLGVVDIPTPWTVDLDSRQFAISTHAHWNDILVLAHDSRAVAEFACQIALSH